MIIYLIFLFGSLSLSKSLESGYLKCPLEWVPSSNGESPESNIIAYSNDEIVCRVMDQQSLTWIPARLSPEDSTVYYSKPSQGTVFESTIYEVLTNPNKCIIKWIDCDTFDETYLKNSVTVSKYYIGRTQLIGKDENIYIVGGSVTLNKEISVSFEGAEVISSEYEVLESTYPLLVATLYNITLSPSLDSIPYTHIRLIDSSTLQHLSSSGNTQHLLEHSGIIQEFFKVTEDSNWLGISTVQITSPIIRDKNLQNFEIESYDNFGLELNRFQDVMIKQNVELSQNSAQICSAAMMSIGQEITYTAMVNFKGSTSMSSKNIKDVIKNSGRDFISVNGNTVTGITRGKLIGDFYLGSTSVIVDTDTFTSCDSILNS